MSIQRITTTIHVLIRIWQEDGKILCEEEFIHVHADPELFLELPLFVRPIEDWVDEILGEIELHEYILPDKFEICEEPILYEAIGEFTIIGYKDDWGEYDEDYDFVLHQWSCEVDEDIKIFGRSKEILCINHMDLN